MCTNWRICTSTIFFWLCTGRVFDVEVAQNSALQTVKVMANVLNAIWRGQLELNKKTSLTPRYSKNILCLNDRFMYITAWEAMGAIKIMFYRNMLCGRIQPEPPQCSPIQTGFSRLSCAKHDFQYCLLQTMIFQIISLVSVRKTVFL